MTDETPAGPSYIIDLDSAENQGRSVASLIAARKCYMCKQADEDLLVLTSSAEDHLAQIKEECSGTADYLLPDTPLKEAIFRVILAHGNRPMTVQEISEELSGRWTVSPFPRDVSAPVLSRVLEVVEGYPIAALPEPEEETAEEPAALAAVPEVAPEPDSEEGGEGGGAE
jgi:hypothetical protein